MGFNYVGIENEDIMYGTNSQLEDYEIDEFARLKKALIITADLDKKNEIRHKMAVLLGMENAEKYREDSSVEVVEEEKKEEVTKTEAKPIPDTIEGILSEYEEILEKINKGEGTSELYERYCFLKQKAEELGNTIEEEAEVESEEPSFEEELKQLNIDLEANKGVKPQSYTRPEITPEEMAALLGEDLPKQETKKGWFQTFSDKISDWRSSSSERKSEQEFDMGALERGYENLEKTETGVVSDETGMEFLPDETETKFIPEEAEIDVIPGKVDTEAEQLILAEIKEEEIVAETGVAQKETGKQDEPKKSEEGTTKADEMDSLSDKLRKEKDIELMAKRIMDPEVAKMIARTILQGENEKGPEKIERGNKQDKKAMNSEERVKLKREVKKFVKENPVIEHGGRKFTDLPSRYIIAELKLTGKLVTLETRGMVTDVTGKTYSIAKNGTMTEEKLSTQKQNPFEVAKKEQSQIGMGSRGRRVIGGAGIEH